MILADTQAVVRLTLEPGKLSKAAASALAQAHLDGSGVALAGTTLWEVAVLATKGRIRPDCPTGEYLQRLEKMFMVLPITAAIAERSTQFSSQFPKDPADRLIAATAAVHGLTLVTSDRLIRKSGEVPCIW